MFNIDLNYLIKYDRPGPRYTSYPTAPHFSEDFTHEKYLDSIIISNKVTPLSDLSLYFHIPFCEKLCYFCGCNMVITHNRDRIRTYLDYIEKELDLVTKYINKNRKVEQLHWGGGTPTYLTPDEISRLSKKINDKFNFYPDSENGCEIDPRGLTREHLEALKDGGFNRISMGVQDFTERVQVSCIELKNQLYPVQPCIREDTCLPAS